MQVEGMSEEDLMSKIKNLNLSEKIQSLLTTVWSYDKAHYCEVSQAGSHTFILPCQHHYPLSMQRM